VRYRHDSPGIAGDDHPILDLSEALGAALRGERRPSPLPADISHLLKFEYHRFYPQMLDWVTECIVEQVEGQGTPPGEIVVLAPFLSDALRFSLMERLGIAASWPARTGLRARCVKTSHAVPVDAGVPGAPGVGHPPEQIRRDLALMQAIDRLDLVRARLLAEIVYRERSGELSSFDPIRSEIQERITYRLGERYERCAGWLSEASLREDELDHFLSSSVW